MPQVKAKDDSRRSAKWHMRRRAIIDLSAEVFAKRGYHATSTIELCEANQLGKGALYYYIGSKEQLLAAIHDRVMDEVLLGADRVALAGENAEQFRKRRRQYERRVEGVFEAGAKSGHFRPLDPRLTARAWLGMHNYTYLWLKANGRLSAKQIASSFADIFVWGTANPSPLMPRDIADGSGERASAEVSPTV